MKIKHIEITNYRGFEKQSFSFDEHLTVIAGNNASGKTAALNAVQVALGAYLRCLRALPAEKAYRRDFSKEEQFVRYVEKVKDYVPNKERTRVEVDVDFYETQVTSTGKYVTKPSPIHWWRELRGNYTTHTKECAGKLIQKVETMEDLRNEDRLPGSKDTQVSNAIYPLVLSFGAKSINYQYRSSLKRKNREKKVQKAYKSALRETVDFQGAFDWLYNYQDNLERNVEFEWTYEAFMRALMRAVPTLKQVRINIKNAQFEGTIEDAVTKRQDTRVFEEMSDGYKSLISMAAEIAHRCIELNGFLGIDAITETPGIVLIDEMELYLHPLWQKHVLNDLQSAFPNIQFIVTTHSPFIIQSVKSKNIISLDGNVNTTDDPLYRSIEDVVMNEMNVDTVRSIKYNEMLSKAEKYYQLVMSDKGDSPEAEQVKKELDEIEVNYSDNPAYVALLRAERQTKR